MNSCMRIMDHSLVHVKVLGCPEIPKQYQKHLGSVTKIGMVGQKTHILFLAKNKITIPVTYNYVPFMKTDRLKSRAIPKLSGSILEMALLNTTIPYLAEFDLV